MWVDGIVNCTIWPALMVVAIGSKAKPGAVTVPAMVAPPQVTRTTAPAASTGGLVPSSPPHADANRTRDTKAGMRIAYG